MARPPRAWQKECDGVLAATFQLRDDALVAATPGAGKTDLALNFAGRLMQSGEIDHIHVTSPTNLISNGWMDSAAALGLRIGCDTNSRLNDLPGVSTTYAQVDRDPRAHAEIVTGRRALAIFDELHHAGDDHSWGRSLKDAFSGARLRLHLSGTPFREDMNRIPFIRYDSAGVCIADYTYGYARAIADGVCRPVSFAPYNTSARFRNGASPEQMASVLRATLAPKTGIIERMVYDSDAELTERRKRWPDAGGLLIAMTQTHARQCADIVQKITGRRPAIVVSDSVSADADLANFKNGDARWLVAVKMVSEGVDIPRLMVAVYATNIVSTLYFQQFVGRVVRMRQAGSDETATIYLPNDERLIAEARGIQSEVRKAAGDTPLTSQIPALDPEIATFAGCAYTVIDTPSYR